MSSSLIVKVLAFRVFLLCLVSVQGSWGQTQDFVTLKATCYPDSRILVSLQTSEPFEGLLYARNHPSSCRVEGQPALLQPVTQLMMTPQECGIRLGLRSKGYEGVSEAEVYVQHDSFVQQVRVPIFRDFFYFHFEKKKKCFMTELPEQSFHNSEAAKSVAGLHRIRRPPMKGSVG